MIGSLLIHTYFGNRILYTNTQTVFKTYLYFCSCQQCLLKKIVLSEQCQRKKNT